jgi:hypothetical protein
MGEYAAKQSCRSEKQKMQDRDSKWLAGFAACKVVKLKNVMR